MQEKKYVSFTKIVDNKYVTQKLIKSTYNTDVKQLVKTI